MKLTVIGGGSSYTPELIAGLIEHHNEVPFAEVCLMDIDPQRVSVLEGLANRMLTDADVPVRATSTTHLENALEGASFVNNLIRVGGQNARLEDERIPLSHGIVGQETTGPGGMMKALRTIPIVLELTARMGEICPKAWLINYTNPAGIVAEAIGKHSNIRFIGLCGGPVNWIEDLVALLEVDESRVTVEWVGLNHLGFAVKVSIDGVDATDQAVEAVGDHWQIDGDLIRCLGAIPASYLRYYYHQDRIVKQASQPGFQLRAEKVSQIERELLAQYAEESLAAKPERLSERGGRGYAAVALAAMGAIYLNLADRQIVQTLNRGAIDGIEDDAAVEVASVVDATGAHPIRFGPLPLPIRGLIQSVKAYESLVVEAAISQSRQVAMQALIAHPLTPSWDRAKALIADLAKANSDWLPWLR